jgi:hypothetical protein
VLVADELAHVHSGLPVGVAAAGHRPPPRR